MRGRDIGGFIAPDHPGTERNLAKDQNDPKE